MRFLFRNTSGLRVKACLRCADGWVGGWVWRWVAGTQISYVGEQEACAGCKMDDEEGVSRQYSWDSSKQRLIEVPSKETNIPLQQDSTSICTHTQPPPHPPSITPSLHPPPATHNPFACNLSQAERGFSSFFEHSRCLLPQSAASAVVSAESGQAGERVLRHGPAVGG